jgi:linearmycin/streptolysin S transport system permease protein
MRHVLAIAIKDLRITLRDRAAVVGMLATPLMLALILGMAFGAFGGSHSGIQVVLVDLDGTPTGGQPIAAVLTSPDLAALLTVSVSKDAADARAQIDRGSGTAAVIVPAGFGDSVARAAGIGGAAGASPAVATGAGAAPATVEIYGNPAVPTGVGVVRTVVDGVLARMAAAVAAGQVTAASLTASGIVAPSDPRLAAAVGAAAAQAAGGTGIALREGTSPAPSSTVDYGRVVGPSMAVLFLMFTVTAGARRMLEERDAGTIARLAVTPATRAQILFGKGAGIFLAGGVQMGLLLVATTLIFSISWGSLTGLALLTIALVFAATSWGLLIAGYAKTPAQANQAGTAITIVFGILAGNFVPRAFLPDILKNVSLATPNGLGLEGYQSLAGSGTLTSVMPVIIGLTIAGVVVTAIAVLGSRRRLAGV